MKMKIMLKHVRPVGTKNDRSLISRAVGLSIAVMAILFISQPAIHAQEAKYTREDVTFSSAGLLLKGTLFLPRSEKPVPGVVLLHGSGETKRSDNFYYAQIFARHGIAALTYDKRGVGESQGDPQAWRFFSFDDLATDAAAGVNLLQNHKNIDARRVGIFGASQGGMIAPLAVTKSKGVAFLVQLSAPVTTIGEDMLFDRALRLRSEGFTDEELAEVREMQLVDYDVTRGKRFDEFQALWEKHKTKRWFRRVYRFETPNGINHPYRRWERTVLDFDLVPALQKLDTPMFWLYGEPKLDRHVDVKLSLERVEALRHSGKPYQVLVVKGGDHNLEPAKGNNLEVIESMQASWQRPLFEWLTKILK